MKLSRSPAAGLAARVPLEDVAVGLRLLRRLPTLLRQPIGAEQASATLARRFEQREATFLTWLDEQVYSAPTSPYHALLRLTGCEFGDVERMVRLEGVEDALATLYRHGVYLTVDEFRGRRAVVRGSTKFVVDTVLLRASSSDYFSTQSTGSGGRSLPIRLDLGRIRARVVNSAVFFNARGGLAWQNAAWNVPGAASIFNVLQFPPSAAAPCAGSRRSSHRPAACPPATAGALVCCALAACWLEDRFPHLSTSPQMRPRRSCAGWPTCCGEMRRPTSPPSPAQPSASAGRLWKPGSTCLAPS